MAQDGFTTIRVRNALKDKLEKWRAEFNAKYVKEGGKKSLTLQDFLDRLLPPK